MRIQKSNAFTLMEIMVVLFIIGFLVAYVGPKVARQFTKAGKFKAKMQVTKVKDALMEYKQDVGHYPTQREGLSALVVKPSTKGSNNWDGPYGGVDEDDLLDTFGNEFEYNNPPVKYKGKYRYFEIISPGDAAEDKELVDGI